LPLAKWTGATIRPVTSATDFETAARSFLDLVARVRPDQWDRSALGTWDVRSLVGHTSRVILVVEQYLLAPAPAEATTPDAEGYYLELFTDLTDHDAIRRRGIGAGQDIGPHSPAEFAASLERALSLVVESGPDRIVATGPIAVRLDEYLRTRVLELVIHCMDIARATGLEHRIPIGLVADVADLSARIAVRRGHGETVLFALSGRAALPDGFSVLT
jgi:uncharacterized protein (TIGR03083 family)